MENLIKWFDENNKCLEIFSDPKTKKYTMRRNYNKIHKKIKI